MPDTVFRTPRQKWALPGGRHDWTVKITRVVLPMLIGVLAAGLVTAPLVLGGEISFVLDKNKVAVAKERMRVTAALYRGEDSKGQPFSISAGSAVQVSSKDPVVRLQDMVAQITLPEGPASLTAAAGRYNMDNEIVNVDGPIAFKTSDGYSLTTRDVLISLKNRKVASAGPVSGTLPLGSFTAGRITADLANRSVVLEGGAHLHIVQGRAR
jgi:lipopolysaccharide export system protein LptC